MSKVSADISMSLDGFIAGPRDSVELGLGEGGEQLHEWLFDLESWRARHGLACGQSNADAEVLDEAFRNVGALVMGRRMFDLAEAAWGDDPPFHNPVFVVTHRERAALPKAGGTTFHFVTDDVESALAQARQAAKEKDVAVPGGASIIQQLLRTRLLDELQVHLVPILLGGGRRLFDELGPEPPVLQSTRVIASDGVTHLRLRVVK